MPFMADIIQTFEALGFDNLKEKTAAAEVFFRSNFGNSSEQYDLTFSSPLLRCRDVVVKYGLEGELRVAESLLEDEQLMDIQDEEDLIGVLHEVVEFEFRFIKDAHDLAVYGLSNEEYYGIGMDAEYLYVIRVDDLSENPMVHAADFKLNKGIALPTYRLREFLEVLVLDRNQSL